MKSLKMTTNQIPSSEPSEQPLNMSVIPANLHDCAEEVYQDKLYSYYNVSTSIIGAEIIVTVLANDLVKHTAGNGVKGYWVGVGIHSSIFEGEDTSVYVGWGKPIETELGEPMTEFSQQEESGEMYNTFYFNAESAVQHDQEGYIVVIRGNLHYHFKIDFSQVHILSDANPGVIKTWSALSTQEVKDHYLFGIDLSDQEGNPLPESLIAHYIDAAVDWIQTLLDITITETECTAEQHDYVRSDYQNWGFIQLAHNPVKEIKGLRMMYGNRPSVEIPLDWIKLDKLTGQLHLFPSAGSAGSLIIGNTGLLYGFHGAWSFAPQLWEVDYVAGMDENDPLMPVALLREAIMKRASMGILNVWGDLILGAGIASQSVSIDGVSQSIGTTQSAMFGGASARVNEYSTDLKERLIPALRQKFGGIRMIVV